MTQLPDQPESTTRWKQLIARAAWFLYAKVFMAVLLLWLMYQVGYMIWHIDEVPPPPHLLEEVEEAPDADLHYTVVDLLRIAERADRVDGEAAREELEALDQQYVHLTGYLRLVDDSIGDRVWALVATAEVATAARPPAPHEYVRILHLKTQSIPSPHVRVEVSGKLELGRKVDERGESYFRMAYATDTGMRFRTIPRPDMTPATPDSDGLPLDDF